VKWRRGILATLAPLDLGDVERPPILQVVDDALRVGLLVDLGLLAVDVMELGRELLLALLEQRFDGPILDRLERTDLPLALDDQAQRDGLHASGRNPLLHRFPEDRARLVADQTIEHATRLLRLDFLRVDLPGVLDGAANGVLCDLVEEHTPDRHAQRAALGADLSRYVLRDGFALAIGVGRDQDFSAVLRRVLDVGDRFFLPRIGTRSGVKPFSTSIPSFFSGKSMMWPTVARTR
jgi:hypothetical protein